jgi:hypothetical protein
MEINKKPKAIAAYIQEEFTMAGKLMPCSEKTIPQVPAVI